MTHEASTPQEPKPGEGARALSARRRLIQGSFAAPVALTLCSGGAFAGSLTGIQIALQTPQNPAPSSTLGTGGTNGTWLKVPVYKDSSNVLFVKGDDLSTIPAGAGRSNFSLVSTITTSNAYKVSDFSAVALNTLGTLTPASQWAAVRVNIDSSKAVIITGITGVGSGAGAAVPLSAWASITPLG